MFPSARQFSNGPELLSKLTLCNILKCLFSLLVNTFAEELTLTCELNGGRTALLLCFDREVGDPLTLQLATTEIFDLSPTVRSSETVCSLSYLGFSIEGKIYSLENLSVIGSK